jgi:predicted SprT family Zn-dependent metalloprotease
MSRGKGKAWKAVLLEAKRQMYRNECEFAEDNRPVGLIDQLYLNLNAEHFDNCLPHQLQVTYNGRLKRALGKAYFRWDDYGEGAVMIPTKIEINRGHRWTNRFLRKVMIHEMCHIWAYQTHNENGHGRKFWSKMMALGYPKTHDWDDSQPYERDIYC